MEKRRERQSAFQTELQTWGYRAKTIVLCPLEKKYKGIKGQYTFDIYKNNLLFLFSRILKVNLIYKIFHTKLKVKKRESDSSFQARQIERCMARI